MCALGFVFLVAVNAAHAGAFFTIVSQIGAVSAALLKGLQVRRTEMGGWQCLKMMYECMNVGLRYRLVYPYHRVDLSH